MLYIEHIFQIIEWYNLIGNHLEAKMRVHKASEIYKNDLSTKSGPWNEETWMFSNYQSNQDNFKMFSTLPPNLWSS